jgi:hypothetical protein
MDERVKKLLRNAESLESSKQNFLTLFQDISELFRPVRDNVITKRSEGDKSSFDIIFDSYPILAVETFASILSGVITNKSVKWFQINTVDEELNEVNEVSEWLNKVTEITWNKLYNTQSRFEQSLLEGFKDIAAFGTVATLVEEGKRHDLNFITQHIRNYLISEDSEGKIGGIILKTELTASQVLDKWDGRGEIHKTIRDCAEKDPYKKFSFQLHINQRQKRDRTKIDTANKAIEGIWLDVSNKVIVEEIGWDSFPVAVGRSEKSTDELYGTSRAMMALPDARQLNIMQKQYNESVELTLKPALIVNADFDGRINLSPMAINKAKNNQLTAGRSAIEAINNIGPIQGTFESIQEKKRSIQEIFFLDKLKIFDNPNATATQVLELRAEGFRIMSSVASSIQEYLDMLLDRSWDILFRKSYAVNDLKGGASSFNLLPGAVFPEMPKILHKAPDLKITFINPINQSQQTTEINSIDVLLQTAATTAQMQPESIDVVNFDEVLRKKASILTIDPKLINDDKTVKANREARQQQIEQQAAIENEQNKSIAAKNYSQAGVPIE